MKKALMIILVCLPGIAMSQSVAYKGIEWISSLSWDQILEKAKQQNKHIFVDCYTTWCGPCKTMDKEVYPKEIVGEVMNQKFISVKVQVDTTKNDNEAIKAWYRDARNLQKYYKVNSFPTFLFFSPTGDIVHRYSGAVNDKVLITIAERALDPDRQFYTLLRNYQIGKKDYGKLKYLTITLKEMGEIELSKQMTRDYINNYLNYQGDEKLFQKGELEFIKDNFGQLKSKDRIVSFLYKNADSINRILKHDDVSQFMMSAIITREEVEPIIWPGNKGISDIPKWEHLFQKIKKKYNYYYADRVILDAKLRWYNEKQDWPNIVKYNIEKVERKGIDTSFMGKILLNNMIFAIIFKYSNKKEELNKGIEWMEKILKSIPNDPDIIDTYANLLYKVGRTGEAIIWQNKAMTEDENTAYDKKRKPNPVYRQKVEMMRKGIPTWTLN